MSVASNGSGKSLVCEALRGGATGRAPWVPFVGCHAGALLGVSAAEYLRSADLIVRGVEAALTRYRPDGLPIAFDLQVEAEQLGCELKWADDNPPSVVTHPLLNGAALGDLRQPRLDEGRMAILMDAATRLCRAHGDVAFYGLVTGPFTLALHLLGTEIFMRMFDAPNEVHALMAFARDAAITVSRGYLAAGCSVVAMVDPMTSQIGPDQFREFVTPYAQPIFDDIAERGGLGSFFVCGHAQKNLDAMCECRPHNVSVDENIPLKVARDACRKRKVSFGGNLQLTTVLLLGKPDDAERNAVECLDIGGRDGYVLAPGCDLPYATPPENLEAIGRLVRDEYRQQVVRTMVTQQAADDVLDLSQYGAADRVVVDVITLDSEACTPCQYMVEAVRRVAPEFDGIVVWREHKIKQRDELVFMSSLFVKNVPTICIDGEITFVSRIPREEELVEAIQKRINAKIRDRIRQRRAAVFVLGADDPRRAEVLSQVERAVTELGVDVAVTTVEDEAEIRSYGVHPAQTPAIVTARYQVKSTRRTPELPVLKEWIKSLL